MYVEDVASTNGTILNDKRVRSLTKFTPVAVLRLGKAECHILPKGAPMERRQRKAQGESSGLGKWVGAALLLILVVLFAKWRGWL
jgi:pSer/pThr/pTyr-binding forkhead associated (FHA) protein